MSYKNGIGLSVCVNGRPIKEYSYGGDSFIAARHGTNYSIRIKNDNSFKVMVVVSVDGLDVITGKAADETNKGYILDAYSATEIKGYRISDENSAAFVFTTKDKSYVQNVKGNARNSGVIGIRVFREQPAPNPVPAVVHHYHPQPYPVYVAPPYYLYPWNPYPSTVWCHSSATGDNAQSRNLSFTNSGTTTGGCAQSFGATTNSVMYVNRTSNASGGTSNINAQALNSSNFDAPISYKQFDTGTGWGKRLNDKVRREYFEKGDLLTEVVIYYASKDALLGMGIDLSENPKVSEEESMPKAFNSKYCQPPKNWNGQEKDKQLKIKFT